MSDHSNHDIAERKYEVTPLELFFDLVFAFAISQLSQHLFTHLTWRGAAETLVLLLAVFTGWFTTSWSATIVRADQTPTRWLMMAVMLLGLFMNASITRAFTMSGWGLVIPMLLIYVGRAVWAIVYSTHAVFREHYQRTLIWVIATVPLWITGAAASSEARLPWWALATVIDQVGRLLAHPIPGRRLQSENIEFDADHLLERCRLFLLIALGESVITTGAAIAAASLAPMTLAMGAFALVLTVSLWALIFGRTHRIILHYAKATTNPILVSRHAVNVLAVMVGGLIAVAVANREIIAHPYGHTGISLSLLLAGGPILFLAAQGWYLWVLPKHRPKLHVFGAAALLLIGFITLAVPPYAALLLVSITVMLIAMVGR